MASHRPQFLLEWLERTSHAISTEWRGHLRVAGGQAKQRSVLLKVAYSDGSLYYVVSFQERLTGG